jgi:hypothetical protein
VLGGIEYHRQMIAIFERFRTLAMRGTDWEGDLDQLRSGYLPPRFPRS